MLAMGVRASIAAATTGLAACASTPAPTQERLAYDPFQNANEAVYRFNDGLDRALVQPVAAGYDAVTPPFLQRRVRDFIDHLRTPIWFANDVLQGNGEDAARQAARFAINTTAGLGGLFDVAADNAGLEKEPEDFGQTLAVWGVPEGPFLVLPLVGPTTLRDAPGRAVDIVFDPFTWTRFDGAEGLQTGVRVVDVLDARARGDSVIARVRASPDPYVSLRSIYLQNRRGDIDEWSDPYTDLPEFD